jgi:hypothetical protein
MLFLRSDVWGFLLQDIPRIKARPDPYEINIARRWMLGCSLRADGFDPPEQALIACYDSTSPEPLFVEWVAGNNRSISVNDAIRRAVVMAPGCLPVEVQLFVTASTGGPPIRAEVKHGPKVVVQRSVLPTEHASPLKATATAVHICENHLGAYGSRDDVSELFSTEFVLPDGDIVFGPFTPGTYELMILDATGKTVWEQTKVIELR